MSSYPKWLYHASKEPALVKDEGAHKELGAGWFESPADCKAELKAEEKPAEEPKAETKPKKVK